MLRTRIAWHELTREEVIDPDLPICDAHHHLWHGGAPPPRNRDRYLLEEYLADAAGGHNIVSSVYVEGRSMYRTGGPEELRSIGETEFANGVAAMSASGLYGHPLVAAAIVGHADLRQGAAVGSVLEAHMRASSRFRGVRYGTSWDENPADVQIAHPAPKGLLLDGTFRNGLACLAELGLSFDAWVVFTQLEELADLARSLPNLQIILGHFGGFMGIGRYAQGDGAFLQWKRGMGAVASCPNVFVKLGGVGIARNGFAWERYSFPPSSVDIARRFTPFCMHCIESFGVERCMFESNFPPDGQVLSYSVLWNAYKRIAEKFSPDERDALFHDTAVKTYRIAD